MHPKTGLEKSPSSAVQTLASTCAQHKAVPPLYCVYILLFCMYICTLCTYSTYTVLCIRTAFLYVCTYIHCIVYTYCFSVRMYLHTYTVLCIRTAFLYVCTYIHSSLSWHMHSGNPPSFLTRPNHSHLCPAVPRPPGTSFPAPQDAPLWT